MGAPEDIESLRARSITKLDNNAALDHIGVLIDASLDAGFGRGADRALYLLDEFTQRDLIATQRAIAEYFRANAWGVKEEVAGNRGSWSWENHEREQQILALSRAVSHSGFQELDSVRRCQIITNRANQLNTIGRFTEAIEGWDNALRIIPKFAMACANRGYGLKYYCGLLEDDNERAIFLLHAYDSLLAATADDAVYDSGYSNDLFQQITKEADACASVADLDRIRALQDLDGLPLGRNKAERLYRHWCLNHRLFLNPLNDLGAHSIAALDELVLPSILENFGERSGNGTPPPIIGFFNQIKQEYASARFMLYEGLQTTSVHFSDRGVRMHDTLDYPVYSFATERIRTAFRIAYSLLDKLAFFIDHYWKLGKTADRINFKNVWMLEGKTRLLDVFNLSENWPLRGLYWISKEIFDDRLKQTTGPDARELHGIRNALEHKYLQVHEGWAWRIMRVPPSAHGLGLSIDSDLLEAKALRMMKITRSALVQLALAIGVEERARARANPDAIFGSLPLYGLNDRRKRRDPS